MGMTREQRQSRKFAVYVLRDPRTQSVRWVGISSNVKRRIHSHFAHRNWPMRSKSQAAYADWMRSLASCGLRPVLEVVSDGYEYSYDDALLVESELMAVYQIAGHPLLNTQSAEVAS